jgi:hypothetical protein
MRESVERSSLTSFKASVYLQGLSHRENRKTTGKMRL